MWEKKSVSTAVLRNISISLVKPNKIDMSLVKQIYSSEKPPLTSAKLFIFYLIFLNCRASIKQMYVLNFSSCMVNGNAAVVHGWVLLLLFFKTFCVITTFFAFAWSFMLLIKSDHNQTSTIYVHKAPSMRRTLTSHRIMCGEKYGSIFKAYSALGVNTIITRSQQDEGCS